MQKSSLIDRWAEDINGFSVIEKNTNGGKGSGNFGHEGRPGKIGGSGKGTGKESEYDEYITRGARFSKLNQQTNWNSYELHSILPYFGDFANTSRVQNYLMGGDDSSLSMTVMASDCVIEMKRKMEKTTFQEDETLYRGMLIRNDRLQRSIDNGFTFSGFQSTTMEGNHATEIIKEQLKSEKYDPKFYTPVLLKINAKKGGHFAASPYDVEKEIVLPDNIKFKVKKQSENSSGYKIFEVDYEE